MRYLSTLPVHIITISIYPVLAMYENNIREVQPDVLLRPTITAILLSLLTFLLIKIFLKDWQKTGVVTTFLLILFYTYGHLYEYFQPIYIGDYSLGRHRYLIVIFIFVLIAGLWLILKKIKNFLNATKWLNIFGGILIILPVMQIAYYHFQSTSTTTETIDLFSDEPKLSITDTHQVPDIYYIILDGYTRGDVIAQDFSFDNSGFLNGLEAMGFYVAECSYSNYSYTLGSLTSALNMNYLPTLFKELEQAGVEGEAIWSLLKHSLVRQQLEEIGYSTVAFQTGYAWSELTDADYYLGLWDATSIASISRFESMLLKSTAALIVLDSRIMTLSGNLLNQVNYPFTEFIALERYKLEELPNVASIQEPKFVFVHMLMPHVPIIFGPSGEVLTDPGYYSGPNIMPINDDYLIRGYVGEIQYLNREILRIIPEIIESSERPLVIILQGDHGLRDDNRHKILNAYYFANRDVAELYPNITPINSFRIIFNTFFNAEYLLLEDNIVYDHGDVIKTDAACMGE